MAIVTPRPQPFDRVQADQRVRHPLHAIRGRIFWYVLIEGTALAILFVAACFWLGLALDYLSWAAFSFDWLYTFDEATGTRPTVILRLVILLLVGGTLVALITFKILRRLFKEFNDSAVALLLERHYPRELGDRLITAVELADPKLSEKYGYSQTMVDATIRDAAQRVENLPVHQVFRWGWLKFLVALAVLATVGVYVLVGLAWCGWKLASPMDFAIRFHHTASIWAERNLLLMHSYWPPHTMIELLRFPGNELRVPREEDRPDVKVRAVRWAISASGDEAPRGWRPLRFEDLCDLLPTEMVNIKLPDQWDGWIVDLDDLDPRVPAGAIPKEWGWQGSTNGNIKRQLRTPEIQEMLDASTREALYDMLSWRHWTIDKIELQLQHADKTAKNKVFEAALGGVAGEAALLQHSEQPVAAALLARHKADYDKFMAILEKLEELAERPIMGRTLRKLDDPVEVVALRRSKSGTGTTNCSAIEGRRYIFPLADLKESCEFVISTGDYWTPTKQIKLVPPPMIDQLRIDKEEPAYLYYRFLDNPALLKNKRQRISATSISTTGPYSKILVPLGTNVTIIGHSDRKLKDIRVAEPDAKKREEKTAVTPRALVQLAADQQTFTCGFQDVQRIVEFDFEFKDADGVKGLRRIVILPLEDQAPRINELALAVPPRVRQATDDRARGILAGPHWLVTPDAYLKLRGKIEDDHGLAKLQFKYELQEVDFQNLFAEPDDRRSGDPASQDTRKPSRPVGADIVTGGLQFMPDGNTYGFFAAAFYGGLAQVVKDGSLPPPPPRIDFIALERAKLRLTQKFSWDVTPEELQRLLTIQPAYRKLLLEALDLTAEKRTLLAMADQLKEANQTEGFLREVMDFAGLPADGNERASLMTLASGDPAEALAEILQKLKADPAQLDAARALLKKEPEKTILASWNLLDEDAASGFDVREQLRFIKAIGSTDIQKHFSLRLAIVATDNNIGTGPGVTTAALPYGFLIVSENELLALMMRDQRKYHDLLQGAVQEMEKSRQSLETQLGDYSQAPEEPTKLFVRGDVARKAIHAASITAKAIFGKYEGLLTEMEFNRMKRDRIDKVKSRVAEPLGELTATNGDFTKTEDFANKFCKELAPDADKKDKADLIQQGEDPALLADLRSRKGNHIKNAEETLADMTELIRKLNRILDAMNDVITDDQTVELLVLIEAQHREVDAMIRRYQAEWRQRLIEQLGAPSGGKDKKR
jgi:hypothetical protein